MSSAPVSAQGTCFGYRAVSHIPLGLTRGGTGKPIEITAHTETRPLSDEHLIVEWKPRPGHPFHGRVYLNDKGRYRVWTSDAGWFLVDPDRHVISVPEDGDELRREVRLWSTPMMLLLISRGVLMLHASAVELDGEAALFGGPSRFGKTTLAAAFHAAGHRVLAEDTTAVVLGAQGLEVLPGPALMRIRHDVAETMQLRNVVTVGRDQQRVFLAPYPETRGTSAPLPLRGLFLLRADQQGVRIREPGARSPLLADLWALAFKLPTEEDFERCFSGLVDVVDRAPIWDLYRPMGLERLPETIDAIAQTVS